MPRTAIDVVFTYRSPGETAPEGVRPCRESCRARKREQWRLPAEDTPDDATTDYLHRYFEPTARAIDGLEKARPPRRRLALDLRKPQDYFHRVWSTAIRAADLADGGADEQDEYSDTCTAGDTDPEQDVA
ncbi:hypothetical protein GCM10017557_00120 [Streptomyces aurantiacus]|uniref:Uncharacterized protein n=1 Tax=Streptomyces aurantiacus TaxID=47760 RepID=A0A7G1NPL3_9ACTN|nr:hypothetical protein GCM10017557_00120 [Streptomyces aurantiacus]